MTYQKFDPNQITFDEGLERLNRAAKKVGVDLKGRIITSKDKEISELMRLLQVGNVPEGVLKWQLPVYLNAPSQLFISTVGAETKVPEHFHRDGDGIRFLISGSIIYKNVELTAGDWMFIPAKASYSFEVGRFGATMCYCYCCSCAPRILFGEDVSNPSPLIPA